MMRISRHIAVVAVVAAALGAALPDARAQGLGGVGELLVSGDKALTSGNYRAAVRSYSRAINSDRLEGRQIPLVLSRRGEAQRRLGRPAQAIADLSGALWLSGLSSAERARAHLNRGLAYQAVGMQDRGRADLERARKINPRVKEDTPVASAWGRSGSSTAAAPAPGLSVQSAPPAAPAPTRSEAPMPGVSVAQHLQADNTPKPTRAEAPKRPQQAAAEEPEAAPQFRTTIIPEQKEQKKAPAPAPSSAPTPKPAAADPFRGWATSVAESPPKEQTESAEQTKSAEQTESAEQPVEEKARSGRFRRFFSGLWGSSEREKNAGNDAGAGSAPLASGERTRTAKATPPAAEPAAGATPAGRSETRVGYNLQLAAVRTESEAQATWKRLAERHRSLLRGREPTIEKTELGTLGTFYRLQIGPFADKRESLRLCNAFKRNGIDCFLVTQ